MRRREPPQPETGKPPSWVTSYLPGLVKFNGDLAALDRARAKYCAENGCYRNCTPFGRHNCQTRAGRVGSVRVTNTIEEDADTRR